MRLLLHKLMVLYLLGTAVVGHAAGLWAGQVVYVVDGDTVHVKPQSGGDVRKIRLKDMDAPEICQSWGPESRQALSGLLLGQMVWVQPLGKDDYQRMLARVFVERQDAGAWMVSQGHAWSYRWRGRQAPYDELEAQAHAQRRGLFSQSGLESPRNFRRRHGSCYAH